MVATTKPIAPTTIHWTWVSNLAWWRTPRVAEYRLSRPSVHSARMTTISGQSTAARNRRHRLTPIVVRGRSRPVPLIAARLLEPPERPRPPEPPGPRGLPEPGDRRGLPEPGDRRGPPRPPAAGGPW